MVAVFQQSLNSRERATDSVKAIETLKRRFYETRIWLSQSTCEKDESVLQELTEIHNYFCIVGYPGGFDQQPDSKAWREAARRAEEKLGPLNAALESDFRTLLGVE
jgi:hypothetical protein